MLEPAGGPIEHVYFIEDGVASVVAQSKGNPEIEVGITGLEGMTGLALVEADDRSPFETFVQVSGSAIRVDAAHFSAAIAASPAFRDLTLRYARAFHLQVAGTAISNGRSKLEERLARWLLMVHDRVGKSFNITHEFLAVMLAVRRAGVTLALQILEGKGLIRASRGTVTVVDRDGLIETSNGAYGLAEREYERLLG
jgi:CRP-like cAMP-binding protein